MESLIQAIESIRSEIRAINQRMDSFVDQITQIKMFHHNHTDDLYKKVEQKIESYSVVLSKYEKVSTVCSQIKEKLTKHYDEKIQEVKDFKNDFMLGMISRFNTLEDYIKNERFHSILTELNKLEDEYHEKAVKMVKKMAVKKLGEHHERNRKPKRSPG